MNSGVSSGEVVFTVVVVAARWSKLIACREDNFPITKSFLVVETFSVLFFVSPLFSHFIGGGATKGPISIPSPKARGRGILSVCGSLVGIPNAA